MKILLAEHFGTCFGVRDAIAQAEQLAPKAPLTILGELVHNPVVRERLRAHGAREGSLEQVSGIGILPMDHGLEAHATSFTRHDHRARRFRPKAREMASCGI
jgi:4-hydroxy-3-methylbut-2-enyl diphosphate reductase IspH